MIITQHYEKVTKTVSNYTLRVKQYRKRHQLLRIWGMKTQFTSRYRVPYRFGSCDAMRAIAATKCSGRKLALHCGLSANTVAVAARYILYFVPVSACLVINIVLRSNPRKNNNIYFKKCQRDYIFFIIYLLYA